MKVGKGYYEISANIMSLKKETENVYCAVLSAGNEMGSSIPGQFINVQVSQEFNSPVLRRPFAVSSVNGNEFEFIFSVVGRGTKLLAGMLETQKTINVLGPLGNGFIDGEAGRKLLIAGGLGIAPIKRLADHFHDMNIPVTILWGNRTSGDFFDTVHYNRENSEILCSTDDGSKGFKGNVLDLLKNELGSGNIGSLNNYDIFAVGPDPMMRSVAEFVERNNARCQVSLETPMACGMGVCQGCAVKKRDSEGYYLVCKDGPVFYSDQIVF
ncbi:MAG: dihydroorotate dehydrogenase electron transfer subunit [Candidatus Delongbacteria bacterium]|jgi:dihydroorotate dehydrogenase electron transfer subunit|nr:dihydroorotate dehydrogenase electron transfer subunit [Candidatus Delongbacteria bacterium]MDY0017254.1 dihydroorotate dehydrogenase electron transfer subunit [Candidatus Delongbacteria bacterium]